MKKNYILIILFIYLIIPLGCETSTSVDLLVENTSVQKSFNLKKIDGQFKGLNLDIKWDNPVLVSKNAYVYPMGFKEELKGTYELYATYNLLVQNVNTKPTFRIIKFISSKRYSNLNYNNLKEKKFSGTLIFYDMKSSPQNTVVYQNGYKSKKYKINSINNSDFKYVPENTCFDCYILVTTWRWTDYYNQATGAFMWSSDVTRSSEYVYVGDGAGGYSNYQSVHSHIDGPHGPSSGSPNNNVNHPTEVLIDPSVYQTNPCYQEVLDKLLAMNNPLIHEAISKFCDNPKFDLVIKVGDCDNSIDTGCMNDKDYDKTGQLEVIIQDKTLNPIDFVVTVLHEAIHAEIFRYVKNNTDEIIQINDKPGLFESYARYKNLVSDGNLDHPYMMDHYITPIAEVLQELDNYKYDVNYYKTFAMDGLRAFAMDIESVQDRDWIDDNYLDERANITENFEINCDE